MNELRHRDPLTTTPETIRWDAMSAWCPSCTCGWHKAIDAFDVTPPEPICRNPQCQCHNSFWQSVDFDQLHESTKRRIWGDR